MFKPQIEILESKLLLTEPVILLKVGTVLHEKFIMDSCDRHNSHIHLRSHTAERIRLGGIPPAMPQT